MLKVWLAGSRSFGAAVFRELLETEGVEVVAVTTPRDENDTLLQVAASHKVTNFSVLHPPWVGDLGIDVIVGAQNYVHISREARAAAEHGAIGYHPSLLPRHRGKRSIEHTIEKGDPIAGGTVYQLDDGWDTGPIIRQKWCHVVPGWTASDLWRERLFDMGVTMLLEVVWGLAHGTVPLTIEQDERVATLAN